MVKPPKIFKDFLRGHFYAIIIFCFFFADFFAPPLKIAPMAPPIYATVLVLPKRMLYKYVRQIVKVST